MATPQRPLSPHLQVYRWQITMTLSILHRITGVVLAFGAFGLAGWLFLVSEDGRTRAPDVAFVEYDEFLAFASSIPGRILIAGFSYCLIYHFLNGIRHLFWDVGKGFEIKQFTTSGWAVVVLSFVLTAVLWVVALNQHGGL